MRNVLTIGSLLGFAVFIVGLASMRSDIQIIIALVGFFAGLTLLGLSAAVGRGDRILRTLQRFEDEAKGRDDSSR